ncbi:tyrosine-type recombinase/integrase [Nonomuraea angiospora]|uniref:Integrase n=1 Tax=Nonomuraea angiospora TaxID=46172 RepID=A0ABR9LTP1_9ACTN|nr:tyrosine-type recombinase/integrase [Nonomuraea angiospora]MBE1584028.1 integrase [Nonomuraea angiospora]
MDHYLRHLRFGRGRAESTTKSYAGHLKRFERWRQSRGLTWEEAARDIAGHLIERRITPRAHPGRGRGRAPSDAALGPALAAIHGFYRHAADVGEVNDQVLRLLFEVIEGDRLPYGERERSLVLRPRLRVDARPSYSAHLGPPEATADEVAALLEQVATARDACMVGFLAGLGLRIGQLAAVRREDIHLVPPGRTVPGCAYRHGPHLHVVRRDGHPRGAISKSRSTNVLPVPGPLVMLYAGWLNERRTIPAAATSPWAFVSFDGPAHTAAGQPLSTRRIYGIVVDLAAKAGLRHIHPHMLRHAFGAAASDLDIARDVLQRLLGHDALASQEIYRHAGAARIVEAATLISGRLIEGHDVP